MPKRDMRRYAGGILFDGERVLLGKRSATRDRFPGVWDIFGGHIEPGETARQALLRELREELGIEVSQAEPVGIVSGRDETDMLAYEMHVFLVHGWSYRLRLRGSEHEDMRWFAPVELDGLLSIIDPRLPAFIQHILGSHAKEDNHVRQSTLSPQEGL